MLLKIVYLKHSEKVTKTLAMLEIFGVVAEKDKQIN